MLAKHEADFETERRHLAIQIERDAEELRTAILDLQEAVKNPLRSIALVRDRSGTLLMAGLLIGLWLGGRRNGV